MKLRVAVSLAVLLFAALACQQQTAPPPAAPAPAAQAAAPAAAAPAAPAPAVDPNAIAELPDYPGATVTAFSAKGPHEGWTRSAERKLTSTAAYADVRAFYQTAISQNGWAVTRVQEKVDEVEWKLAKGASVAEVKVETEGALRGIEVRLERKDR